MACTTTITVPFEDKAFCLRFYAQYLITMRDIGTDTMYISQSPMRDVLEHMSTGCLIGYYFQKKAWADGVYTPHSKEKEQRLNRFGDLSFHIKHITVKQFSQDTDLPMGPPPVGLVDATFGFEWNDGGRNHTASQVISFQSITPEQFAGHMGGLSVAVGWINI